MSIIEIPKQLIDAAKDKKLIAFVGAGLSMGEGLPSWKDVVVNILSDYEGYIDNAEDYKKALESGILSPLEVLDKLESSKKYIFEGFEKGLKDGVQESSLIKLIGDQVQGVITTNFDKLLESNIDFSRIVTKNSAYGLSKLNFNEKFIIKLHGDVSEIDNCVIFTSQYNKLYSDDQLAAFKLKNIFSDYSVVFLGFSFEDPFVAELFNYVSELMDGMGPDHFIVSNVDRDIKGLSCINIGTFDNLFAFFDKLSNELQAEVPVQKPVIEELVGKKEIQIDGNDLPPDVSDWVGRSEELKILDNDSFRVLFITGIGGEGKSALASHYINIEKVLERYECVGWRDFKEEDHRFSSKIISMILGVSRKYKSSELVGLDEAKLVDVLFECLHKRKALFVLDNVDSYIDLESFEPVGGIGYLCKKAQEPSHESKFIFTCRPFIRYASVGFYQFTLGGLTEENIIDYFLKAHLPISREKTINFAIRSNALTNGHALWISLIVAQAKRGEKALEIFLENIERGGPVSKGDSTILSENVLKSVWASLHDRDRLLLRTLAEAVRAETEEDFSDVLKGELNFKNFSKALKALKNFNLIVHKRESNYIELHPLVKEFVKSNYQSGDRSKYISLLISYYDQFALVLRPKLSHKLSFDEFTNFTNKAELYINKGDYQSAISTLREIHSAMSAAGYLEEYLRVSKLLYTSFNWSKKKIRELTHFESLLEWTVKSAVELGDDGYVDDLIGKYEALIENKEQAYIRLCYMKSYVQWFRGAYDKAIDYSDEAVYLLESGKQDDTFSIKHNRALAYRDSGDPELVNKALDYFLGSHTLNEVVGTKKSNIGNGPFYGNVGKCLYILGQRDNALLAFCKSFYSIFHSDDSSRLINLGYASLWVSEVLKDNSNKEPALYFFKFAIESWKGSSPVLANSHKDLFSDLLGNSTYNSILSQERWRVEKYCTEWVDKFLES